MNQPFQSQTFAITGRLDAGTRGMVQSLIISKGARVTSRVRKKTTTILIVGHEPGDNALQAAAKLGIPTMPQEEFYAYLKAQPDIIYPNNEDIPLSEALPVPEPDPDEVALLTIFEIIQYTMPDGTWLGPKNWKRVSLPEALKHLDEQYDAQSLSGSTPTPEPLPIPHDQEAPCPIEKRKLTYQEDPFAHLKSATAMLIACIVLFVVLGADPVDILFLKGGIPGMLSNILKLCIALSPFCIWAFAHGIRTGDDPK